MVEHLLPKQMVRVRFPLLAMKIQVIMPWALAFAAGCMIYVVEEEMVPEMKGDEHNHFGVWNFIIGFVIMMVLDCL